MISIREAKTKKELKQFILFSFDLYKDNPNWIPPIIQDELITFDKTQNPDIMINLRPEDYEELARENLQFHCQNHDCQGLQSRSPFCSSR
jgi:hypothetical protein